MGRPQQFDYDTVVDKAMEVFWRKGYEATSIQDLVDGTGLNRGSLYNTFDSKEGLFAVVRDRYSQISLATALIEEAKTAKPREAIEDFLLTLAKRIAKDPDHRGCLIVNTATELAPHNIDARDWVNDAVKDLENALTTLITRGQKNKSFKSKEKPRVLARLVLASVQGMLVIGKANPSPKVLKDIAQAALGALR